MQPYVPSGAPALIGHMPSEGFGVELFHSRVGLPQITAKHAINFTICTTRFLSFFFFFSPPHPPHNFRHDERTQVPTEKRR